MIRPDCARILELAGQYDTIPVCRQVYADVTTPIALLLKLSRISGRFFLLESVEGGETWGRYSFLGFDPLLRARCKGGLVTIEQGGEVTEERTKRPLDALRAILARNRAPRIEGLPPFTGGLVGFFGYEMVSYAEPTLDLPRADSDDFDLMLFDKVIAYDHLRQKIDLIVNIKTDNVMENYGRALAQLERLARLVADPLPPETPRAPEKPQFTCNMTREAYCDIVERAKQHIFDGDIFQAVLSRRFQAPYQGSLLDAYRVLRTTNPSPYMVFLQSDQTQLISASPETLVRLKDGRLATFPVAGSRPRGATREEDGALETELLADEKELSEHDMLVDLARNDIGRVSRYGSVEVTDYRMIHKYSRIMHIASVVQGNIRPDRDALDALESVLPAGTLSGAPKIRACQIIADLERAPRGVYGGAIGYLDFSGNMDTCIAIRMAVKRDGVVSVQAGGGIVADSVPEREWEESGNKARALIEAIQRANEVRD